MGNVSDLQILEIAVRAVEKKNVDSDAPATVKFNRRPLRAVGVDCGAANEMDGGDLPHRRGHLPPLPVPHEGHVPGELEPADRRRLLPRRPRRCRLISRAEQPDVRRIGRRPPVRAGPEARDRRAFLPRPLRRHPPPEGAEHGVPGAHGAGHPPGQVQAHRRADGLREAPGQAQQPDNARAAHHGAHVLHRSAEDRLGTGSARRASLYSTPISGGFKPGVYPKGLLHGRRRGQVEGAQRPSPPGGEHQVRDG